MRWYSYIFIVALWMVSGCCKDCTDPGNPECSNYDPCYGKQETSADFVCEVYVGNRWFESDMDCGGNLWRFRAKDTTADEYLWEVGADVFKTKSFTLGGFPLGRYIPIQLTVKRKSPHLSCFPKDDGFDTKTKQIYTYPDCQDFFYDYKNNLPAKNTTTKMLNGKYRGYTKRHPGQMFDVELYFVKEHNVGSVYAVDPWAGTRLRNDIMAPWFDIVNIPYRGFSLFKTFHTQGKYQNTGGDPIIDGHKPYDGEGGGMINACHLVNQFSQWPGFADSVPSTRYYGFFKSYAYLDYNDRDKFTIEYWYQDTITRKVLKDTFVGTRIP